jgi:transposase-like protein
MKANVPKTLNDAIRYFANPDNCLSTAIALRWPNGVTCPTCGSQNVTLLKTRQIWKCKAGHADKRQFSAKVGTIFEDSPIGLDKWFTAMWLIANCKNGVSSYEVARDLGVTQKTAWFMMHRIRLAMQSGTFERLAGPIEADESYIGGLARNMHASKRNEVNRHGQGGKEIVMGVLERGGKVKVWHLRDKTTDSLQSKIRENVWPGSVVNTDAFDAYNGLDRDFLHKVINHAEAYVNGQIHTNGIENFWSLLKRGLKGTYVSVEPFHLFRYLDEQAFRYNKRKTDDGSRFVEALAGVTGKRLTYQHLTGKDELASALS